MMTSSMLNLIPMASDGQMSVRIFQNPPVTTANGALATLLLTVALIHWVASSKLYKNIPILKHIPAVFLVYFVPMVLNTIGLFDPSTTSAIYNTLKLLALPMSLVLLLVGTDVPLIMRLGPKAILIMVLASIGVVVGGFIAFAATQGFIGDPDLWRGVGALAGSWIGGSANMIAAKEALQCPQRVFTPMAIIDIICGYGWMIVVIWFATWQAKYDKWNRADTRVIEELNTKMGEIHAQRSKPIKTPALLAMLGVSAIIAHLCMISGRFVDDTMIHMPSNERLSKLEALMTDADWTTFEEKLGTLAEGVDVSGFPQMLPIERVDRMGEIDDANDESATIALRLTLEEKDIDPYQVEYPLYALGGIVNYLALGLILASLIGIALSFTGLRSLEDSGASEIGYALLFLVLASIGSTADLNKIFGQEAYLLLGTIWILVFVLVLFVLTKVFRAPLFLVATASQANIGGAVSAPIVAGVYQPNLAVVGILMAVLGQVLGTFLAIATGWLCSLIAIGGG